MDIEFRHIRYFRVIAEEKSFRKASEVLQVAQPALSRSIKQLEALLETKLLDRSKHHVALTQAGDAFFNKSRLVSDQLNDLKKTVILAGNGKVGQLKIGYSDFAMTGNLPNIIKNFKAAFPGIHLEILNFHSVQQVQMLRDRSLDIAFLTIPPKIEELGYVVIQEDEFSAILPKAHRLAQTDGILQLSSLKKEPFIVGSQKYWSHYNMQLNHLCLNAGFLPNIEQEAGSVEGIMGLVSASMGVTIFPSGIGRYIGGGVSIRKIDLPNKVLSTAMSWSKENMEPIQKTFIEYIARYLAGQFI